MAKNYKYTFTGRKESVLTDEEHKAVSDVVLKSGGFVRLRGGDLCFHTSMIKFIETTEDVPDHQMFAPVLPPPPERKANPLSQKIRDGKKELYAKMGWPLND